VYCEEGAVLKASSSFPVDTKFIYFLANGGAHEVSWEGGTVDGRLMPTKVGTAAPDALVFNGGEAYITKLNVNNVTVIINNDRTGTAGDSCMFVAGCDDVSITNSKFQGAVDLGIYISGQSTTFVGERVYVAGNTFYECASSIGSKRDYKNHIITGNFIRNTSTGIFIGGETEAANTAKKAVISNNVIQRCVRGIEARVCNGTVITSNRIEDYGINAAGTPVSDAAIAINGSNNCVVSNNITLFSGAYTPTAGVTSVRIGNRVIGPTTYTSQNNLINGNIFNAGPVVIVNNAVVETAGSGSDYNIASNNIAENFVISPPYSFIGANSNFGQNQTIKGANPYLLIWDTDSAIASVDAKVRLAESGVGGVIDNYWDVKFGGSGTSFGLQFVKNEVTHFRVNGEAVSVNFIPTTTPANRVAGDVYYDSGTNKLRCWIGSSWNDLF